VVVLGNGVDILVDDVFKVLPSILIVVVVSVVKIVLIEAFEVEV